MPRSLVLAPTRELADQVASSFEKYATYQKLSWALLIGGVSFEDQIKKLDRGVDVVIATPGRLLDHFERGRLLLTGVQIMVVDEADRMLDMGFIPDLERIFKLTPAQKQTLFFSATMPPEITRLTTQFLRDPLRIEVSRQATTGENISQFIARIPLGDPKAKRLALRALIERSEIVNGIVFCNRKTEVDIVAKSLKVHGLDALPIHGDLDQSVRMKTLDSFRKGDLKLLVASDVAARGLDIPAVSHVFNYDVPHHAEDYVHRIGRTGRAGRLGEAFMIVTPNDQKSYEKVLKLTKKEPASLTLELDWEEARAASERDTERRKSRPDPARPRRDRDKSRPVKDHGERAPMEALAPTPRAANAEARSDIRDAQPERVGERLEVDRPRRGPSRERAPRPSRPRDGAGREGGTPAPERALRERPERAPSPSPAYAVDADEAPPPPLRRERPQAAPARAGATAPQRAPRDDVGPAVVGFGSDTPAFLRGR